MRKPTSQSGFTLVELMISIAISMAVMGAVFSSFNAQDNAYRVQRDTTEINHSSRAAMDLMIKELQMTGYGMPEDSLNDWITWTELDTNPQVTNGADGAPDLIRFGAAFDGTVATLDEDANSGSTSLTLQSGQGSRFNTSNRSVFLIGYNQTGVVTNVNGDTLTIDMNGPDGGNEALDESYPDGTPVEPIKVISYYVEGTNLMRDEHQGAGAQILSENIEDFQVSRTGNRLTLTLTVRAAHADPNYIHPVKGDHYRRTTSSATASLRNG